MKESEVSRESDKFMELISANERIIYKICTCYISAEYPLDDLFQEVICHLWEAWPRFRNESSVSTWIYRITLNTCISGLRRLKSRPAAVGIDGLPDNFVQPGDASDDVREMYRLIYSLSPSERLLMLLWLEEKSYREIAAITGLTAVHVGVKIKRIKDKLVHMSNQ